MSKLDSLDGRLDMAEPVLFLHFDSFFPLENGLLFCDLLLLVEVLLQHLTLCVSVVIKVHILQRTPLTGHLLIIIVRDEAGVGRTSSELLLRPHHILYRNSILLRFFRFLDRGIPRFLI